MSDFEDLRVRCVELALDLLWKRKEFLQSRNYGESDRIRKMICDHGMKVQDIRDEKHIDSNLDPNFFEHFECKDIHHCLREFDHEERFWRIIKQFSEELINK